MPPPTGAKAGRALANLIGETMVKARHATARLEADQKTKWHHDYAEYMEREMAPVLRNLFAHVVDNPETPEPIRAYFAEMTGPTHQSTLFLSLAAFLGIGLAGPAAAAAGLTQRLQVDSLRKWGDVPLTPQELATGVVKGHIDNDLAHKEALKSGVHEVNLDRMVKITGNPPGPQTLIAMLNRGIIDEERFAEGIAQGLIKTEWTDEIRKLRFSPPTAQEAIAAEVEGHIDAGMAKSLLFDNGVDEFWHDILYESAGEPPGNMEMLELLNRHVVDEGTVKQSVRESRVKNKYIDAILALRRRLMPERTVVSGISKNVLTHDEGIERLLELGFNAVDAAALAAEASSTRMAHHRQTAESQVLAAYEDGMTPAVEAQAMIEKLGYEPAEARFALQLADHRRQDRFRQAAVARIHTLFVSHHIDNAKASTSLDSLGIHPDMRGNLLQLWSLERSANVPRLTVAEWQGLLKRGAITDAGFLQEMRNYGYTDRDAGYLLDLTSPAPRGGRPPAGP